MKKRIGKDEDLDRQKNRRSTRSKAEEPKEPPKKYLHHMRSSDDALRMISRMVNKIENSQIAVDQGRACLYGAKIFLEALQAMQALKQAELEAKLEGRLEALEKLQKEMYRGVRG